MSTDVPVKNGEYHLHFWGGIENEGLATAKFGEQRDYWFATVEERALFKAEVYLFAKAAGQIVVFSEHEGALALKRTVAKMVLLYQGKNYPYEYSFGYGYPAESARFMFFDGNYSCDCNLSRFLNGAHPHALIPPLECGYQIQIKDFTIEYLD